MPEEPARENVDAQDYAFTTAENENEATYAEGASANPGAAVTVASGGVQAAIQAQGFVGDGSN